MQDRSINVVSSDYGSTEFVHCLDCAETQDGRECYDCHVPLCELCYRVNGGFCFWHSVYNEQNADNAESAVNQLCLPDSISPLNLFK